MARPSPLMGLYIGTTKVCALIAQVEAGDRLQLLGAGTVPSAGLRRGVVADLHAATEAVGQAVERAEKAAGREIRSVYVALSGEHITGQNTRGVVAVSSPDREISSADVGRALEAARMGAVPTADREVLHVLPRHFVVDGTDGVGGEADHLRRRVHAPHVRLDEGGAGAAERVAHARGPVLSEEYFDQLGHKLAEIRVESVNVLRAFPFRQVALTPVEVKVFDRCLRRDRLEVGERKAVVVGVTGYPQAAPFYRLRGLQATLPQASLCPYVTRFRVTVKPLLAVWPSRVGGRAPGRRGEAGLR